ncbi:hypothetical protein BDB01DRAFT_722585 [Pilobolus umbonatus]|nr:hypothetical protein BDB01DRAFT_722585 [Pilobolus umbonatus]
MKTAIKLYFQSEHEINIPEAAVTMIPLEGEGKVENRVDDLYSTLINHSDWLEAISSADVILWATHSQGTPVSFLLLQRLLERGHIHVTRQSVCISAMAGISHGPFPTLKASLIVKYFEADAARELFDFMDPNSKISIKYTQALAYVLKGGVKVVLTGSMQDQVVPFYSAIVTGVNHPNILRSVFIDHHLYAKDDFLINLVVFAIQLRNAGLSDHNLLVYLSDVLAGSIYSIEGGHSTVYEEVEVYMTAVKYVFQTAPFGKHVRYFSPECIIQRPPFLKTQSYSHLPSISSSADTSSQAEEPHMDHFQAQLQINPYYLPWVMHAICSDQRILADEVLKGALLRVLALFKVWEPASSRLKELKFRLDPISTIRI